MLFGHSYEPGSIIRFTYNRSKTDRYKEVLVLVSNWQGKLHGIDMRRLTEAERHVLKTILDPKSRNKRHGIPLIDDILRRMDPPELIKQPVAFYNQFVKQFIRNTDAYRTYFPMFMSGTTVVKHSEVGSSHMNPNPLFKRVETKPSKTVGTVKPNSPMRPKPTRPRMNPRGRRK